MNFVDKQLLRWRDTSRNKQLAEIDKTHMAIKKEIWNAKSKGITGDEVKEEDENGVDDDENDNDNDNSDNKSNDKQNNNSTNTNTNSSNASQSDDTIIPMTIVTPTQAIQQLVLHILQHNLHSIHQSHQSMLYHHLNHQWKNIQHQQ